MQVDEFSSTPKYLQLTNSILNAIEAGKLKKDDIVPSINELSFELEVSRDTAEKGYKHLKKMGASFYAASAMMTGIAAPGIIAAWSDLEIATQGPYGPYIYRFRGQEYSTVYKNPCFKPARFNGTQLISDQNKCIYIKHQFFILKTPG